MEREAGLCRVVVWGSCSKGATTRSLGKDRPEKRQLVRLVDTDKERTAPEIQIGIDCQRLLSIAEDVGLKRGAGL